MYLVRFVRRDHQPDEEYFYNAQQDACHHLSLFENDDSGLYSRIEVIKIRGTLNILVACLIPDN